MPQLPNSLRIAAALLLCVVLAACGSTVQVGQGAGQVPGASEIAGADGLEMGETGAGGVDPAALGAGGGAVGGSGSGTTVAGGAGGAGVGGAAAGGSSGAAAGGGSGAGGAPAGTTSGGSTGGGPGGPAPGPSKGQTATTIKLGFEYSSDNERANAAIGADVSGGDPKGQAEALIDYYNARGGIAGRKVEPVYHDYSAFQDIRQQQETACQKFTEDDPVFAVFILDPGPQYVTCLNRGGVGAIVGDALVPADDAMYANNPGLVTPSALSLTGVARLYPTGLKASGFFKPEALDKSTTVGLITFDEERYRNATEQVYEPGLNRIGEELDVVRYVHYAASANEVGQMSAEIGSALIAFRQAGVDHVTIIEESALIAFAFLQAADRQGYKPQYGFNSTSGGQLFIDQLDPPREQLANARLVGWQPQFDVPTRFVEPWAAQQECLAIFKRAGIQFEDGNSKALGLLDCAGMGFLHAAMEAAPGKLQFSSLITGTDRLGTSYVSPWNKNTRFGPNRHYGTASYLTAAYNAGCDCFKPSSGLKSIP